MLFVSGGGGELGHSFVKVMEDYRVLFLSEIGDFDCLCCVSDHRLATRTGARSAGSLAPFWRTPFPRIPPVLNRTLQC